MFNLPHFSDLEDCELRRVIADMLFQRDVAQCFLDRALQEMADRKKDKREGISFRSSENNGEPVH